MPFILNPLMCNPFSCPYTFLSLITTPEIITTVHKCAELPVVQTESNFSSEFSLSLVVYLYY